MSTTCAQSSGVNAMSVSTPQLSAKSIVGYAAGDAGCNIAFQMTGLFLLVFYTNVVGISPAHAGSIFLFVKIWDAFADLFAGRIVDRTMTRWGKFRPFLLWYSVPLLAANLLCFWIPVTDYTMKIVWAVASYALMGLLYSMVNIPYGSLAGAMSQNPVDRSRLSAGRMVGSGTTILILALVLAPQIKASTNLSVTFFVTAVGFLVVGTVLFAITFLTSKETVHRDVERVSFRQTVQTVRRNRPLVRLCVSSFFYLTGQNVLSALGIYIANYVLMQYAGAGNWLATVVTIITTGAVLYSAPFAPALARKLGKKHGFITACAVTLVGCAVFGLSRTLIVGLVGLFIVGIGIAILNTMTWAMEADTVEYGEYKTGIRTEGATYAAFSFTRKVGQAVGAALASYGLAFVGFSGTATGQSQETLRGMGIVAATLPAVCFLLAGLVMWRYPLTEEKFRAITAEILANRSRRHNRPEAEPTEPGPTDAR